MKPLLCALLAFAALLPATAAQANPELAKRKGCLACHGMDRKVVGPALKDIAATYRDQKDIAPVLAERIRQGSSGRWGGKAFMPPNAVTPEEARELAAWVLTIR
jgi:cytochrome c